MKKSGEIKERREESEVNKTYFQHEKNLHKT